MPNEMNHAEVAERLAHIAFDLENNLNRDEISVVNSAAADERRIANGELVEVVHASWIEDGDIQICSECGEEHEWQDYRASYCENCGALMNGKDDSHEHTK